MMRDMICDFARQIATLSKAFDDSCEGACFGMIALIVIFLTVFWIGGAI